MYNRTMHGILTHRRLNNGLGITVLVLAMYIFIWPFIPSITWWTKYQAPLISQVPAVTLPANDVVPADNTLIIPRLDMRQQVFDGPDTSTLNKGIWRLPNSATPDVLGNTIMAGHRFTYSGQAVFYYLDKVQVNDNIYVYWQGKRYEYVVTATNVVPPTDEKLIAQTPEPTLTIYTCTPVWSAKDRLVITAKLAEVQ